MRKGIEFVKMVAGGNDFVIFESKNQKSQIKNLAELAKEVCNRKYGIGADGLLMIEESKIANFKMRIFNPDGSEAEMCGNGIRCVAFWANSKSKKQEVKILKIETKAGLVETEINKDRVKVKMPEPKDLKMNIIINIRGEKYSVHYINTGVPHTVLFVNDLKNTNVKELGKIIRFHPKFLPQGTNVDFVQIKDEKNIFLRTYERGVEDETLACGTGAVASAIISKIKYQKSKIEKNNNINVQTSGGEVLKVYFERIENNFKNVWLEGKAKIICKGVYYG